MASSGWNHPFEDPIPLPTGRALVTLRDASGYMMALPKAEHDAPEWQTAVEAVIMAAEGRGPLLHARVGMMRAINRGVEIPKTVRRKAVKKYRIIR